MSTKTETGSSVDSGVQLSEWQAGVLGGIAGAVLMGGAISAMNPPTIEVAIPALYGLSGGLLGWVVHVSHGAVLGVVFAAIAELDAVSADSVAAKLGLGVAWGIVTWILLAALVMPVWLGAVGFPNAPPLPNFAVPSLVWHLIYGVALGGVYHVVR